MLKQVTDQSLAVKKEVGSAFPFKVIDGRVKLVQELDHLLVLDKGLKEHKYLFYYRVESGLVYIPIALYPLYEPQVFGNTL